MDSERDLQAESDSILRAELREQMRAMRGEPGPGPEADRGRWYAADSSSYDHLVIDDSNPTRLRVDATYSSPLTVSFGSGEAIAGSGIATVGLDALNNKENQKVGLKSDLEIAREWRMKLAPLYAALESGDVLTEDISEILLALSQISGVQDGNQVLLSELVACARNGRDLAGMVSNLIKIGKNNGWMRYA